MLLCFKSTGDWMNFTMFVLKVLGKIWSIAFKYHLRMPPYYTLVLRSLASLEGRISHANFVTFLFFLGVLLLLECKDLCLVSHSIYSFHLSVFFKMLILMPLSWTCVFVFLIILFSGLAVAADPNFKTFEAAYPYVVQKLLTDNSVDTRRILHSVPNF